MTGLEVKETQCCTYFIKKCLPRILCNTRKKYLRQWEEKEGGKKASQNYTHIFSLKDFFLILRELFCIFIRFLNTSNQNLMTEIHLELGTGLPLATSARTCSVYTQKVNPTHSCISHQIICMEEKICQQKLELTCKNLSLQQTWGVTRFTDIHCKIESFLFGSVYFTHTPFLGTKRKSKN